MTRTRTTELPTRRVTTIGLAALLATALAAGCASTRVVTPSAKIDLPSRWSHAERASPAASPDLARWWESLRDPTLDALVSDALTGNRDLQTAQSRLRQARAQRNLAQANLAPSVTASASASGSKRSDSDASGTVSSSLDASWEPDVFAGKRSGVRAAAADLAASEEDLHNTQVSLVAEVAVNYVDLRGYQARLRIAEANVASQAETLQLTEWRAQAGLVGSLDVEQARTSLEQTKAQVPSLRTSIAQAQHRLAVLVGLAPTALAERLDPVAEVPTADDRIDVGIPADTLRQRPDVRAAEQRIVAETARLAKARASRLPSFTLRGSLGTETMTGVLTGGTSVASSLAASVVQTIFDGGRIRQQIEVQGAVLDQAVISYESTVLTALEDVENALVSRARIRERLATLSAAAESARSAALLARQQYTAGLADFQTVLDTQRTVLSVEDGLATARVSQTEALIQLYKALGGGWSGGQAASTAQTTGGRP